MSTRVLLLFDSVAQSDESFITLFECMAFEARVYGPIGEKPAFVAKALRVYPKLHSSINVTKLSLVTEEKRHVKTMKTGKPRETR